MNRDQAVDLVKARLARSRDTSLTELIQNEMLLVQQKLENSPFLPWFLHTRKTDLVTVAGQDYIDVPTGFLRESEEDYFRIVASDGTIAKVKKGDLSDLGDQSGMPTRYALSGSAFYFSPIPDAVYTLQLWYYKADVTLETNVENAWLANGAELFIAETALVMAQKYIRDDAIVKALVPDVALATKRLMAFTQSRLDANREYVAED